MDIFDSFIEKYNNIKNIGKYQANTFGSTVESLKTSDTSDGQPDYNKTKSDVKFFEKGTNDIRKKLAENNIKLANLNRYQINIEGFYDSIFTSVCDDSFAPLKKDGTRATAALEILSRTEQQAKIIDMFATIFDKYGEEDRAKLIFKLSNPDLQKDDKLLGDITKILQEWKDGKESVDIDSSGKITPKEDHRNSYGNVGVFAEKIIEASEKYDLPTEFKEAMKNKESSANPLNEYTIKEFGFSDDNLMGMFLKNPIIEKLIIDNAFITIHKLKDALFTDIPGKIKDWSEKEFEYFDTNTKNILSMLSDFNVQRALKETLTEPKCNPSGDFLKDENYTEGQWFIDEINKINSMSDAKLGQFSKNKEFKKLIENASFSLPCLSEIRKDGEKDIANLGVSQPKNGVNLTAQDSIDLYQKNFVKRKLDIFSDEITQILSRAVGNSHGAEGLRPSVFNLSTLNPKLLGQKKENIEEYFSTKRGIVSHNYKSAGATFLEKNIEANMQNKVDTKHGDQRKEMATIIQKINTLGERKDSRCHKIRGDSPSEFIKKMDGLLASTGAFEPFNKIKDSNVRSEYTKKLEDLMKSYKSLNSIISKDQNTIIIFQEYMELEKAKRMEKLTS